MQNREGTLDNIFLASIRAGAEGVFDKLFLLGLQFDGHGRSLVNFRLPYSALSDSIGSALAARRAGR